MKKQQTTTTETPDQQESLASFSVRLTRELLTELQRLAAQHERSMNGEIVWALRAYVTNTRKAATTVNVTRTAQNFDLFDDWVASNPLVAYVTPEPASEWVCLDCTASGTVGLALTPVRLDETNLAGMIRYNIRYQEDVCSICGQDAFVDRRPPEDED
jgi:Arc-like DNA binding domain